MHNYSKTYKSIPELKLAFYVILLLSFLFPIIMGFLDAQHQNAASIISEIIINIFLLNLIAVLNYSILQVGNKLASNYTTNWLLHLLELMIVLFCVYWLFTGVYYVLVVNTNHLEGNWKGTPEFRSFIGNNLIGVCFIYLFQLGLNLSNIALQKASQSERMEREYAHVQLQALRNQVNPHFLFNSLSVLSSLVHISPEISERFLVQLSVAYRYILEQKDLEWVSLAAELQFLQAYFFLLQIRFDKKIRLNQNIDLDTEVYKLPPLTLQLLVENAVKHNRMSSTEPLEINIYNKGERLVVENNISLRNHSEPSTGIGLENIRNRYAFITKQQVEISNGGGRFYVNIPLLKK